MSSLPRLMAGEQPDDTQGIATIEFKNGDDTVIKTLVGCIVHIRPMDKSLRNILKVENGNKNVKYFVYVPWFQSCRPSQLSESTILQIRLHRYRKPLDPKGFEVSKFDFGKYKDDQYFVIPCDKKNFQSSSFLKKWSSELLLYNNPTNISKFQANKVFNGFKKETVQNSNKILYKFQEFKIRDSGGVDQTVFSELEEQSVLQVHREKKRYVIGCYKKEDDNQIKMFSFLLKGNDAQRGNTVEVTESEKKSLICQTFGPKVLDMHNKHYNVVQYVCIMLNAKQLKGNNFRSVASKIGLDYFESQELARAGNPMEEVFGVMISRAKTVENFVDILYEIDRNDVVDQMYEKSLAVTRST